MSWVSRPPESLMRYMGFDCIATARDYEAMLLEPEWQEDRVKNLYDIHCKLSIIAAEMHTTGIYIHKGNHEYMVWCIEKEIEELKEAFLKKVNIDGMRCTANDLRSLIYKRHENGRIARFSLPDPYSEKMYTDETLSKISVDEASLLSLITSGEAPDELIHIIDTYWVCESAKKQASFLKSDLLINAIGPDGRLRPGWNSCGTDTMRFSCSKPNVMQIQQMLRAYMGPGPGKVLVHADKSSMELRVMAAVADDTELQRRLDGGDVYGEDAKDWFGLPRDMNVKKAKPKARQSCKIIHLASQYAAGVATIHSQALASDRSFKFETTRLLNNGFKRTYSATCEYWEAEQKRVLSCGYSEGRLLQGRRYYPKPPPITEVANWPVQRTASEMMCLEMLELDAALKRHVPTANIVIILHDAFDVECDAKDESIVSCIMEEVMHKEYTIDGRKRDFPVEIKFSRYDESAEALGDAVGFGGLSMTGTWCDV